MGPKLNSKPPSLGFFTGIIEFSSILMTRMSGGLGNGTFLGARMSGGLGNGAFLGARMSGGRGGGTLPLWPRA